MKRPTLAMIIGVTLLLGGCAYETDYDRYGNETRTYPTLNCGVNGSCADGFYDANGWWHDRY